jgi:hypothetical protein
MFDFSGFFSRFPLFAYAGFFIHSTAYAACCTLAARLVPVACSMASSTTNFPQPEREVM